MEVAGEALARAPRRRGGRLPARFKAAGFFFALQVSGGIIAAPLNKSTRLS